MYTMQTTTVDAFFGRGRRNVRLVRISTVRIKNPPIIRPTFRRRRGRRSASN